MVPDTGGQRGMVVNNGSQGSGRSPRPISISLDLDLVNRSACVKTPVRTGRFMWMELCS